ncbi:MAG: thiamine biosynthesis protein ThiS [Planctomycetaceae bacterium]|nr:thiamine biosynthesis protein ThiS [Planctomycetaceae bacterium]MBP63432.1 thiamine biosynthesis protein ThiS [Planctomycetaceae bacterium]
MKLIFNDETSEVPEETTIAQLLEQLQLVSQHVAVEVNYQLVPRSEHKQHMLQDGDRLEIVTLVGGG